MGKMLDRFKKNSKRIGNTFERKINELNFDNYNRKHINPNNRKQIGNFVDGRKEDKKDFDDIDDYNDDIDNYNDNFDNDRLDDETSIIPAQKPESFHHFILENQYKDLERSIRGLKDVWDKHNQKWITKRKEIHCFTDEEAEEILRTAQSHLSTDIKLGNIKTDSFAYYMDAIYKELAFLFESIAEYRYGRYGDYELQYKMKLQNQKIFLELFTRIQANYSRSIGGSENKATHGSVKGQESLQSGDRDYFGKDRGYT